MKLVAGHAFGRYVYEFPHVCPGDECAIGRWLEEGHRKVLRGPLAPRSGDTFTVTLWSTEGGVDTEGADDA